ncbi:MAG: hypothetical protein JSW54_10550, partial [Fidelibacterota bacterium]
SVIKEVNKLVISGDMTATDLYCAQLLDEQDGTFSKELILPTLEYAHTLGLGVMDLTQVKIVELSA